MALKVKSFVFEDPNFHDTPTVENEEVAYQFIDQRRSPMQKKIAVIMKSTTSPPGTRVKVIKEDGTEQYEVDVDGDPNKWAVNDYGEVLLYVTHDSTKELKLLAATGDVKWTVDVSDLSIRGVAVGTSYAIAFISGATLRFYSTANGNLVKEVSTGRPEVYGPYFCSHDGYWAVCDGQDYTTLFVSVDGDVYCYDPPDNRGAPRTTDAYASVVGTAKGYLVFRTGEMVEIGTGDDFVWVAPSGDCAMLIREQKIELYSIWRAGFAKMTETPFAADQTGCISADISFYGKYALILHNTCDVCVYDLKAQEYKDSVHNALCSRAVMVCAD